VQKYNSKVELSAIANGGLVKAVTMHQQKLLSHGGDTLPDWVSRCIIPFFTRGCLIRPFP